MINLLSPQLKKVVWVTYMQRLGYVIAGGIILSCILGGIFLVPAYLLAQGKRDSALRQAELADASLARHEGDQAKSVLMFTKERMRILEGVLEQKSTKNLIEDVTSVRRTITITGIFVDSNEDSLSIRIIGTAPTRDDLLTFASRLRSLEYITDADLPVSNLINDKNISFSITAHGTK